jgi:hypothetical protein
LLAPSTTIRRYLPFVRRLGRRVGMGVNPKCRPGRAVARRFFSGVVLRGTRDDICD